MKYFKILGLLSLQTFLSVGAIAQTQEKAAQSAYLPERQAEGKKIIYNLYVSDTTVNYTGKNVKGSAINGRIPGPDLNFDLGDTAWIYVHNEMKERTSIHWHGLVLPNEEDGVPFLTTSMVKPHSTHLYKFPITHTGTYWYHSHAGLQQQSGIYGAFIVHDPNEHIKNQETWVLSDWTNDNPKQVNRFLHQGNDWYEIKKNAVQSYGEALISGNLGRKVTNEWKRMEAMDVSDVAYDAFTSNGKLNVQAPKYKAGDKVRFHVVNGSSSTYFWLTWAGGKMTVVENDGMPVKPVQVDKMIIGTAETYDIEVTIPENMQYELRATSEDRIGHTSYFLGSGMKMPAPVLGRLKYFDGMEMMNNMMKMNGRMNPMGMKMSLQKMDMNSVMYPELHSDDSKSSDDNDMAGMDMSNMKMSDNKMTSDSNTTAPPKNFKDAVVLNYNMLESPKNTTLPSGPWKTLRFELWGNMDRYVWTINNKTVSESDEIMIKQGENVRIILTNQSMMRHPMHLHGHFFRVKNKFGEYSPLKTTLDIMPMETDTLEFRGNAYGSWFFHCHILYHMMSGMGRVFRYENSPYNPQAPDPKMAYKMTGMDDKMWYPQVDAAFENNGTNGTAMLFNTRYQLWTDWRLGTSTYKGYEVETHFGRYIGRMQWLLPFVGWDYRYRTGRVVDDNIFGQVNTKNSRKVFCAGFQYKLPMLVVAETRVDTEGRIRFQLERDDLHITRRLSAEGYWNTDREWLAGLEYRAGKYISLASHYDSNMGWGAGVELHY